MGPSGDSVVPSESGAEWEKDGGVRSRVSLASLGTQEGLTRGSQGHV